MPHEALEPLLQDEKGTMISKEIQSLPSSLSHPHTRTYTHTYTHFFSSGKGVTENKEICKVTLPLKRALACNYICLKFTEHPAYSKKHSLDSPT